MGKTLPWTGLLIGMRRTPARRAVLAALQRLAVPISAEELYRRLRGRWNLVTVYRTVEFMESKGIINAVRLQNRSVLYELPRIHHHHVQCRRCGRIVDIPACVADVAAEAVQKLGFRLQTHRLEFIGECLRHIR